MIKRVRHFCTTQYLDNSCCATCIKILHQVILSSFNVSLTDIIRILIIHVGVPVHIDYRIYLPLDTGPFNFKSFVVIFPPPTLPLVLQIGAEWPMAHIGGRFLDSSEAKDQILIDHKVQLQILSSGKPMILMILSREKVTNFRPVSMHILAIGNHIKHMKQLQKWETDLLKEGNLCFCVTTSFHWISIITSTSTSLFLGQVIKKKEMIDEDL